MKLPSHPLLSGPLSVSLSLCAFCLAGFAASSQAQVVFTQDFSSSPNTADYVGSGPNQFDGILGGTGNAFAVTSGALQTTKTAAGSAAINRITALSAISGKAASFQFDFSASGVTTNASTNDLIFQVGSGFTNITSAENSAVYQNFNIDLQGGTSFRVAGLGPVFSGLQTITLDLNRSGSTVRFTPPSGGTLALANNNFAIFVGTTNIFLSAANVDQLPVQGNTALDITQFKLRYQSPGDNGTVTVDNFVVTGVPEPSTWALLAAGMGLLGLSVLHRRIA